jgi:NADP-dependent aldehyde dehydrogenase
MDPVLSRDARTGQPRSQVAVEAGPAEVDAAVRAAHATLGALADRRQRAALLNAAADAVESRADALIAAADAETALGVPRLTGELARVAYQFRFFAGIAADGGYLGVVIDPPDPAAVPPRPELRRWKVPLGTVAVFAASNFPFAFSVPGGDTASALAAGCPVVVKAHPGHPALSAATAAVATAVVREQGWPAGTFAVVQGTDAGVRVLSAPEVKAAGFTGSVAGGRALEQVAQGRPEPIPFYGELGSTNPVVVTPAALAERGPEIAAGFVGSFTLGAGQFCTKPGVLLLPVGHGLEAEIENAVSAAPPAPLLTPSIFAAFGAGLATRAEHAGTRLLATSAATAPDDGRSVTPTVLALSVPTFLADLELLGEECFGPVSLVVEYDSVDELRQVVEALPGSLVASVHLATEDADWVGALLEDLAARTGRLVVNGWPTGVAVTWAMQHGGPHPVTTSSLHTSVGATAPRRWLRPVAYQGVPEQHLPPALQSANPWQVPRRVNGVLTPAPVIGS